MRAAPHALDQALAHIAKSQGVVDLALGETLARLFAGKGLLQLGYSSARDYARERLGIPPRTVQAWAQLARALRERPLLRKAVVAGIVTPRKALTILPVAVGDGEARWAAAARTATVRELEAAVRAAGSEPPAEPEAETFRLGMTPAQQDRLEKALRLADETLGGGVPEWQCLRAISEEWLGEFGPPAEAEEAPERPQGPLAPNPGAVQRLLADIAEARSVVDGQPLPGDARSLDARALRLIAARRAFDVNFGALAARLVARKAWRQLGYPSFHDYCLERLSMSPGIVRQRVWLERRMCALPGLRAALASGKLTYTKALLVASDATPFDIEQRIEEAARTTCQQTEREATAREKRRNRAAGVRRLWAPGDVAATIRDAIASAQLRSARLGRRIDAGEALARIADHFVEVWERHREWRRQSRGRREVLARNNGRCQVPGCSRPARHVHHVIYRSHGGAAEAWNEVAICIPHHLRGIHMGHVTVEGRAGERLVWRFGDEVWVTEGAHDVRRAAPAEAIG